MLLCFLTLYTQNSEKYHLPFFVHSQNDLTQPMSSNISTQYHISCDFSHDHTLCIQASVWHPHLAPDKHLTRSLSDTHLLFSASPWFCTSQIPTFKWKTQPVLKQKCIYHSWVLYFLQLTWIHQSGCWLSQMIWDHLHDGHSQNSQRFNQNTANPPRKFSWFQLTYLQ